MNHTIPPKKNLRIRRTKAAAVLLSFSLFLAPYSSLAGSAAEEGSASDNTVTVYLYRENELLIRGAVTEYEKACQSAAGTPAEEFFPEITWNLVDKSDLSQTEFQALLWEELEAGGGPDLLLTGPGGFLDARSLLESGCLYDLAEYETMFIRDGLENYEKYMPGSLEAGQLDGTQYLFPLTVELPVLVGRTEDLTEAGLDTTWTDFDAFSQNLLAAQEQSGRAAFAETSTLEWLEDYGGGTETLSALESGEDSSFFLPYQALSGGQCLLSGCGKENFYQLIQNLILTEDPSQFSFLFVPNQDGEVLAEVSRAAGVNQNSKNPKAALAALYGLEKAYSSLWGAEDLSSGAGGDETYALISNANITALYSCYQDYALQKNTSSFGVGWCTQFLEQIESETAGAVLKSQTLSSEDSDSGESLTSRPVVTVLYNGNGMGTSEEAPLNGWLVPAAKAQESEKESYVQLIPGFFEEEFLTSQFAEMEKSQAAPDLLIADLERSYLSMEAFQPDSDTLSSLMEERRAELDSLFAVPWDTVLLDGKTAGIPVGLCTYGLWYNRDLLEELGWEEEALLEKPEQWSELVREAAKQAGENGAEQPVQAWLYSNADVFGLVSCFTQETDLFALDEQTASWSANRSLWSEAVADFYSLIQNTGLSECKSSMDAFDQLLSGETLFVLGASSLGKASSGMQPWEETSLGYLPISSYVSGKAACLSANSQHPEAAFDFLLEALQTDSYAENIRKLGLEPVTGEEKRDVVFLPLEQKVSSARDFWEALLEPDADVEELAEEYPPYPWAEEE